MNNKINHKYEPLQLRNRCELNNFLECLLDRHQTSWVESPKAYVTVRRLHYTGVLCTN